MIYFYRFLPHLGFHCFAWKTISGRIVILSSVLSTGTMASVNKDSTAINIKPLQVQDGTRVLIPLFLADTICPFNRKPLTTDTCKSDDEKHKVQQLYTGRSESSVLYLYCTTGSAERLTFPRPYHLLLSSKKCSFRPIFGIENHNESYFLKEAFWFFILIKIHQTNC